MFLRNFGLWVKSRNSERRSGSRELACFHCRLLRLGRRGGAMCVERRRPHAEGPRSSRQGQRWWPPRGGCARRSSLELASAVARAPCRSGSRRRPHGQVYVRLQQKQKKILCERIYQTLGKVTLPSVMVNTLDKVCRFAECKTLTLGKD